MPTLFLPVLSVELDLMHLADCQCEAHDRKLGGQWPDSSILRLDATMPPDQANCPVNQQQVFELTQLCAEGLTVMRVGDSQRRF
jgi:hypothetical protein